MIRRFCGIALVIVPALLLIPAQLLSQKSATRGAALTVAGAGGGCLASNSGSSGGTSGADTKSPHDSFDTANLDRSVLACNDFYQFADGGWVKSHPIPPDHSSWATFNQLHDKNEEVLRQILDEGVYGAFNLLDFIAVEHAPLSVVGGQFEAFHNDLVIVGGQRTAL